jgi:hypothetical protein
MRGLVLFVGLLLIAISWAASVPATAEDCKGNCATVSIPDPVAASSDEKSILTQDCPGGVCPIPQSAPVAQKYEQPRGVLPRVRNRVRQWRPFGGLFQRRRQ